MMADSMNHFPVDRSSKRCRAERKWFTEVASSQKIRGNVARGPSPRTASYHTHFHGQRPGRLTAVG